MPMDVHNFWNGLLQLDSEIRVCDPIVQPAVLLESEKEPLQVSVAKNGIALPHQYEISVGELIRHTRKETIRRCRCPWPRTASRCCDEMRHMGMRS